MQQRLEELRPRLEAYEAFCDELGEQPADVALAWLLHQPAVTAPIIGPRTLDQLTASQRALEVDLSDGALGGSMRSGPAPAAKPPRPTPGDPDKEPLPETIHDFRVDLIVTPDEAIWCAKPHRPPGVLWDHLDQDEMAEAPALAALAARRSDTEAIG
jgi:Aldo/keto reductase family